MNDRQMRLLATYERCLHTVEEQRAPVTAESRGVIERLRDTLADITTWKQAQDAARRARTLTQLRYQLEIVRTQQMLPLAHLARRCFIGETAIQVALRVPHKRAPTLDILAAALGMAKALRPHREVLRAAGVDPERIDMLLHDARHLKKAFPAAYAGMADRAVPTRRLTELFQSARGDILILDALVRARTLGTELYDWKDSRRLHKKIGRPRKRKTASTATQAA